MNHYLLCVSPNHEREMPAWQTSLFNRGIVVMGVRSLAEALPYSRLYSVLMILLEIGDAQRMAPEIRALLADAGDAVPPVIGLMTDRPGPGELAGLAQAGLADVIAADDPEPFILWRLDLLHRLSELARFEQSRMDVGELARKTRTLLHDLSQPLSAVQGRLQLLAARCPADDLNAQTYQDLVRQAFEITHQLMALQQLHRQYSSS